MLGDLLEATDVVPDATGAPMAVHRPASDAGATFARRFATTSLRPSTDDEVLAGLTFAFARGFEVWPTTVPRSSTSPTPRRASSSSAGTGPVITAEEVADGGHGSWLLGGDRIDAAGAGAGAGRVPHRVQVARPGAAGSAVARLPPDRATASLQPP